MLTPDSDTAVAPLINDAARASLRLPAGSPYMNVVTAPTADEELQTLLDAPLFDPWDEEEELCSVDTPFGCMPGPLTTTPTPRLCSHTSRLTVSPSLLAGLERFKQMVREDYYMAEALWAAAACRDGRIDR